MKGSYVGLGDSISIDCYPADDAGLRESSKVGAASRFGAWLVSENYVNDIYNLAEDGFKCDQIRRSIRWVPSEVRHHVNIISLTAGGNDISFGAMEWQRAKQDEHSYPLLMERVKDEYKELCRTVREKFPNSFVIVNTLYDPTDGLGELPNCGRWSSIADWYSRGRRELGEYIKSRDPLPDENFIICDVFKLFDGHGMAESVWGSRWYYKHFMIEPGYTGALALAKQWKHELRKQSQFSEYTQDSLSLTR